ncbi:hypothetical protein IFM89_025377 [Coptis chinensis]|uniref:Uncharacterized protein n=1 Tax=Coptis chinensis TaxID=261450 RepID=A0A835IPP6_9MAGN|nr:hypothetical protein IFM89_025377 [Coptis chinensis]
METSLHHHHTTTIFSSTKPLLPPQLRPSSITIPLFSASTTIYTAPVSLRKKKHIGIVHFSAADSTSSLSVNDNDDTPSQDLAILLEVEGVLMDVYRWGNRQAFNLAFQKLGLDCANWTEPIYLDLVRKAFDDEERMLVLFFNRIGWPTSLPTNEKESFMKGVMREKRNALDELIITKSLPLRPGIEEFLDDALVGGIPVVILTAYCTNDEKMTRPIIEKLGQERISRIKIVGKEDVERSFYGQLVLSKSVSSGLDEQLAEEVRKAANAEKHKIAKEVEAMLNVSVEIGSGTTERSSNGRTNPWVSGSGKNNFQRIVATLRAGAEYAGVPVQNCVLIAGSKSGLLGAERIGMPCVVLRSSLTSRTEFPSANAVMDGFGGPDLTVSRLLQKDQLEA